MIDSQVLDKVLTIRQELPSIGGRKLHYLLRKTLLKSGHSTLSRDRLFELLREHNLLIKRKRKYAITTDSNHPYKKYDNLIKAKEISRSNQLWVSDITYLRNKDNFCYLSLVTDVYSRKIIGYYLSESLSLDGTLKALKKAMKKAKPEYHHSDRGCQYCSYAYTNELKKYNTKISMTQNGNCYDNAIAERVNGILKQEFNLNANFKSFEDAKLAVRQAINNYNHKRPHWSINLKVPADVYIYAA